MKLNSELEPVKHGHESHKHSQFSHQHKNVSCTHSHGNSTHKKDDTHKHSKKPPSLKISPNKRYGRGEFDSPVQRLITSPLEVQLKNYIISIFKVLTKSSPNDKADLSTEKTDTTLTDQVIIFLGLLFM